MKTMRKLCLTFVVMLLVIMSATPLACKPAEIKQPEFQVLSLEVIPETVVVGKSATITVKVSNVGKVDGRYALVLKVNGVERVRKDIPIATGATEKISLKFLENVVGIYTLEVGGQIAKIRVIEAGLLGQDLTSLRDSNGKIVSIKRLEIESSYKDKVEVYRMRYLSDGLEVVGFLLKPKNNEAKYPVFNF